MMKNNRQNRTRDSATGPRVFASGYSNHGANVFKKSVLGWDSSSYGAHSDIDLNIELLRARSRDLYMGGALVASGAIKTIRTNVIGAGLTVKPSIDGDVLGIPKQEADAWGRAAQREFELWGASVDCDAARQHNFAELQQLAFISWLMNGDVFVLLPFIKRAARPYELCVQLIEADRVCDPQDGSVPRDVKVVKGVEFGPRGEVAAFHICNRHPAYSGAFETEPLAWRRVLAFGRVTGRRNVLHVMESERIGQARGVPFLAPIIEAAKQLGRYTDAELLAAVVSGMFTVFITTENPNSPLGESPIPGEDRVDDADPDSYEMAPGGIVGLGPNEKPQAVNPGRPFAGFTAFVEAICRQMGAALELPYEILIKHFTASYSASRAALLEAWKMYKMRRAWFVNDFCRPIYEEVITEAVETGRLPAPGFIERPELRAAWLRAEWYGPTQGQLDPQKEVNAAVTRVTAGFSTRARETSELTGGDFEANVRQLEHERAMLDAAGLTNEGGSQDGTQPEDMVDEEDSE